MRLADIFIARDAWQHATALRLPAHTAYRLLKYAKRVTAEYDVIEHQRMQLEVLDEQLLLVVRPVVEVDPRRQHVGIRE